MWANGKVCSRIVTLDNRNIISSAILRLRKCQSPTTVISNILGERIKKHVDNVIAVCCNLAYKKHEIF